MARLIKKDEYTPPPSGFGGKAALVFIIISLICGAVYFTTRTVAFAVAGAASFFIAFSLFSSYFSARKRDSEIKQYGDMGEEKAGDVFETYLPDGYTVIQNAVVEFEGETSEIDNIIIGRTGVFIVEVKNLKGEIYGDFGAHDWFQYKTDRYGIDHEDYFYSPVKQVKTHVYRLAHHLKENGVRVYVNAVVYFVNPEARLDITGETDDVALFDYRETNDLIHYILGGEKKLSDKTVNRIKSLIE